LASIFFGSLSERLGRRHTIIVTAVPSLCVLPLWAFSASAVWLTVGALLMQVMVHAPGASSLRRPPFLLHNTAMPHSAADCKTACLADEP
jgi:hypothetical protein